MEQLINVINGIVKANSGKSLHLETQQTNEANDMKQSIGETSKTNSNEADATRILTRMLVFVSKSHRKGLENYGKDIKT